MGLGFVKRGGGETEQVAMAKHANVTLVKIGGALVDDQERMDAFWAGVSQLRTEGPVVVVHGGGPQATALARRLGHEPQIVHGRRVTTDLDLEIMLSAVRGGVNARLVGQAQRHGLPAAGLSGADAGLLRVVRRPPWTIEGETVDFGHVGDVTGADPAVLHALLGAGFLPIVAPLGIDADGNLYNVNADTVARTLAEALGAHRFLLVTDAGGLRRDASDAASHLARCDAETFDAGTAEGWIHGGMRVKLHVAFEARAASIPEVFLLAPEDLATRTNATRVE